MAFLGIGGAAHANVNSLLLSLTEALTAAQTGLFMKNRLAMSTVVQNPLCDQMIAENGFASRPWNTNETTAFHVSTGHGVSPGAQSPQMDLKTVKQNALATSHF